MEMIWLDAITYTINIDRGIVQQQLVGLSGNYYSQGSTSLEIDAQITLDTFTEHFEHLVDNVESIDLAVSSDKHTFIAKNCVITKYSHDISGGIMDISFAGEEISVNDVVTFTTKDDIEITIPYKAYHQLEHTYGDPREMIEDDVKVYVTAVML